MTIDHTLSWEVARVGGMLAFVLATASVVLGLLLSLKAHSASWPRFITNELHRYVTVLTLVFIGVHTLAVLVDPYTGFSPTEVLVPMAAHYRPLWIALGIVSGYLAIAIWASEYIRKYIGYAWWRRFHYLAFGVFLLGALHGVGTGSDTGEAWALAIYAACIGSVAVLIGWRLARSLGPDARNVAVAGVGALVLALALFTIVGPAQAGWNAIANNGNGSGASARWLADHPNGTTADSVASGAPDASFSADVTAAVVADGHLQGSFAGNSQSGTLDLVVRQSGANLALTFADGWSCSGSVNQSGPAALSSTCSAGDGVRIGVVLDDLQRAGNQIEARLKVSRG